MYGECSEPRQGIHAWDKGSQQRSGGDDRCSNAYNVAKPTPEAAAALLHGLGGGVLVVDERGKLLPGVFRHAGGGVGRVVGVADDCQTASEVVAAAADGPVDGLMPQRDVAVGLLGGDDSSE